MKKNIRVFKDNLTELNEEILLTAGKPLEQLTEEEKQNVVLKWTLARGKKPEKKGVIYYITYFLGSALVIAFISCLMLLVLKWFFTILGVI